MTWLSSKNWSKKDVWLNKNYLRIIFFRMSISRRPVHRLDFLPLYLFFSPLCLNCFFLLMMLFTSLLWSHLSRSISHWICLTSVGGKVRIRSDGYLWPWRGIQMNNVKVKTWLLYLYKLIKCKLPFFCWESCGFFISQNKPYHLSFRHCFVFY